MNVAPDDFDLGPLTWVKGELDNALAAAHHALAGWNGADLEPLRIAAAHLHQVYGALQIIDLQGVALVAAATEHLLDDMGKQPHLRQPAAAQVALGAVGALQSYLDGLMAGAPHAELRLTPVYQAIAQQRGGEQPAPSELFFPVTEARPPRRAEEPALDDSARARAIRAARASYQRGLLQVLRDQDADAGLMLMAEAVQRVEGLAPGAVQHGFWWATHGLMGVLQRRAVPTDIWVKRLFGRIDLQMRRVMEGSRQLAERLFNDVLYYVAQDPLPSGRSAEVHDLYRLRRYLPVAQTGLRAELLPFVASLKDHLGQAKDHWIRYCGGRADSLAPFQHAASGLFEAAVRLPNQAMKDLARIIQAVAKRMPGVTDANHNEALQVEMATALLLGQNAAEHFEALDHEFDRQAEAQAMRVQAAIDPNFNTASIPRVDMLDEISRAAQEKLLLAQVTHEIQANLHQVEEALDRFFRDPQDRGGLPRVPALLKQIQGAFHILQLEVPAQLVHEAMARIGHFNDVNVQIPAENLDWVAEALSTLGLYVDALRYGRGDPAPMQRLLATPEARPTAREKSVETQAREEAQRLDAAVEQWLGAGTRLDRAAVKEQLQAELARLARDAELIGDADLRGQADRLLQALERPAGGLASAGRVMPSELARRMADASGETVDRALLGTYIEEAHDVLGAIAVQVSRLQVSPYDTDAFAIVRRGFHTLKGSGRMVGLTELAEPAWEIEQTLNQWLRDEKTPTPDLLTLLEAAGDAFQGWVEALETQGRAEVRADPLIDQARRLRGAPKAEPPPPKPEAGASAEQAARAGASTDTPASVGAQVRPEPAPQQVDLDGHVLGAELLQIFTGEAQQRLADLSIALAEMARAGRAAAWEGFIRAAHTLAGIARTTGFTPLAQDAHAVERWAGAWPDKTERLPDTVVHGLTQAVSHLSAALERIRAGHFPHCSDQVPELLSGLVPPPAPAAAQPEGGPGSDAPPGQALPSPPDPPPAATVTDGADEADPQLLPIFLEEADELLPRIGQALRAWRAQPGQPAAAEALKRELHTLKGSARMAGALALGEHVHRLENQVLEQADEAVGAAFLDHLEQEYDHLHARVEALKHAAAPHAADPGAAAVQTAAAPPPAVAPAPPSPPDRAAASLPARIDAAPGLPVRQTLRLKADVLDTLLNEAGEVAIARARIENVLSGYKLTATELAANVERLRAQLRELEIQAESQMRSRLSQMDEHHFDPLEFDRFTRLQEITRHLAESVNDVSTAQDNLLAGLTEADNALIQQGRMARTLQQELMHLRMVPLDTLAERLHRVVRQSAKDSGRRAQLELSGGRTELDRAMLDKLAAPLEHLVRNAVAHGIEPPAQRLAAGKPEHGAIRLDARQEGNEILLTLSDDGAGVDAAAVEARARALGWLAADQALSPERLESFLFRSGFSTATEVTELAGRGIGLDVVRNDIAGIGGQVRMTSTPGQGTRFTLRLPLTLALTQVVLARAGKQTWALPANLLTEVREVALEQLPALYDAGSLQRHGVAFPLRTLAELVELASQPGDGRFRTFLLLQAGESRLALQIDGTEGNLEAVVKPIGPQLARIPGISGATVLGDGRVALILNPFRLAERAPMPARRTELLPAADQPPLVLVVDDSLTVRKITGRLLERAGYRVDTAKDGVEALERLAQERPAVMLLDIEMPRMDGFEVTQSVRANPHLAALPIIMITSRSADRHRQHALELGVNAYMGKPYQDDALLAEVARLVVAAPVTA